MPANKNSAIDFNGHIRWLCNGKKYRGDGSAIELGSGDKAWYLGQGYDKFIEEKSHE